MRKEKNHFPPEGREAKVENGPNVPGEGPIFPKSDADVLNAVIRSYPINDITIALMHIITKNNVINTNKL